MSVRILFFGLIAEQQGVREQRLELNGSLTLAELLIDLGIDSDMPQMLAVNQQQVSPYTLLSDGDEVAIMPPFSGG